MIIGAQTGTFKSLDSLLRSRNYRNPSRVEESDNAVLDAVKQRLEDAEVPTWEEDNYDPALAATTIEAFIVTPDDDD